LESGTCPPSCMPTCGRRRRRRPPSRSTEHFRDRGRARRGVGASEHLYGNMWVAARLRVSGRSLLDRAPESRATCKCASYSRNDCANVARCIE
jgi:hypothetical protein